MAEPITIVSVRLAEMAVPVPGATSESCGRCGHLVACAPSSRKIIADNPGSAVSFRCLQCAHDLCHERFEPLTDEQRHEIREAFESRCDPW